MKYPDNYYVFANQTIEEREGQKYIAKHTGAIGLYLATKDPKVVQTQCRHRKTDTTLNYLRDLGVFIDFDQINKWGWTFLAERRLFKIENYPRKHLTNK